MLEVGALRRVFHYSSSLILLQLYKQQKFAASALELDRAISKAGNHSVVT